MITRFPGLGLVTGGRVLAELGDDHTRFTGPRALKAYAGSAPHHQILRTQTTVLARHIKKQRLASADYIWAVPSAAGIVVLAHFRTRAFADLGLAADQEHGGGPPRQSLGTPHKADSFAPSEPLSAATAPAQKHDGGRSFHVGTPRSDPALVYLSGSRGWLATSAVPEG
ncbi:MULTISPECIES: transposase [unclassified Streptomyces]|uniref:transposase n=1 Tax=unclassified Streptomyces TaxID=2593676 RepID=UPI00099EFF92|nr:MULTISPECIES: transposase [unclassified Streptomyces]